MKLCDLRMVRYFVADILPPFLKPNKGRMYILFPLPQPVVVKSEVPMTLSLECALSGQANWARQLIKVDSHRQEAQTIERTPRT